VLKGAPKHDAYEHTWKVRFYSFRIERGRHFARRHAISAIGHGVGHIDDIDDSSAFDGAAALIVGLLRRNHRFILVESKGVMVGEVGAGDGGGLGVDLGVQALELARMTLKGSRAGLDGDLGSVLVLHDAQFERVLLAHVSAGKVRSSRRACMLGRVYGCLWFWVGVARTNRQIFLLQV
jgi:hypothetical protein